MYRFLFRPKWIVFHVVVITAAVGMLGLARWQWNRHLQRDAFTSKVEEREKAEPVELVPLLAAKQPADIEYSRVTATGSYLPDAQLIEINKTQGGVNGVDVLTPFQIDGGPIVVVNRGFVADGVVVPAPPTGTMLIGGMARTSEVRRTGELTDNNDGATREVRRVDLPLISKLLDISVAPVYIDFIASKPAADQPPTPVGAPDLSGGPPHVSYTVQWCIFSIAVIAGWVFAIRRSLRTRQRSARRSTGGEPDAVTHDGAIDPATDPATDTVSVERPVQPSV